MDKKGVILYFDQYEIIKGLSQIDKGTLLDAVFEYSINSNEIELSPVLSMAFSFIKNQIDRDKQKYLLRCEKNRKAINKRWNKKDTNVYECIQPNTNDTDTDKDTDKDTDTKRKIEKKVELSFDQRRKDFYESLRSYTPEYGKPMIRNFFDYWSEPNQAKTKMKYEMQKTWLLESRLRTWERRANNGK